MSRRFDAVVIGSGPAGEVAISRLVQQSLRVALCERELIGGSARTGRASRQRRCCVRLRRRRSHVAWRVSLSRARTGRRWLSTVIS